MISLKSYSEDKKNQWNTFVSNSKNGWFLFDRNYMDYHKDRFTDASLMVYDDTTLVALLPANKEKDVWYSHAGLTYGGFITSKEMKAQLMLDIFKELLSYGKKNKLKKIIYKALPFFFHKNPSQEDLYALTRSGATLLKREVSSTIFQEDRIEFNRRKQRSIAEAIKKGLSVKSSQDFEAFYQIVADTLEEKYKKKPVHTAFEMKLLAERFPDNIKLFGCFKDGRMIAGALVYSTEIVAHVQYLFSSKEGKFIGANDLLGEYLIKKKYARIPVFNFGISTENDGKVLNEQLISFKEEFGARGTVLDTYELRF